MNWNLFGTLIEIFSFSYWLCFIVVDIAAEFFRHKAHYHNRYIEIFWKTVKIYRYLRQPRKFMWFTYAISMLVTGMINSWHLWFIIIAFLMAFIDKDTFGDDPRDKKTSKVVTLVKSLGHRLVVIPQNG